MNYQVLYRQFRPKTISEIIGQETIVKTLKNQVTTGNIPHAYLFSGSRGTGKTSAAKILAKAVNCLQPLNGDPCGECKNCIELAQETSLDIIEMDAASNNGVDEIRDLREHVKYPPQVGKYKVYIIDEVHMLSTAAFNALLKTLEEPPSHALFILATTEPQKLPATIISRCQRFEFKRIGADKIARRLQEIAEEMGQKASLKGLQLIARSAEGGMRDALSLLDMCMGTGEEIDEGLVRQVLGTANVGFLFAFSQSLIDHSTNKTLEMIDQLIQDGKEPQVFAKDVSYHLRALLLGKTAKEEMTDILDITKEDTMEYITQGEQISIDELLYITDLFMEMESRLRYASSPRILLETIAIKASMANQMRFTESLEDRVAALENMVREGGSLSHQGQSMIQGTSQGAPAKDKKDEEKKITPTEKPTEIPRGDKSSLGAAGAKASVQSPLKQGSQGEEQIWNQVMKILQKNQAGIFGQLREGKFIGKKGNLYQVEFSKTNVFMANYLNNEGRKDTISSCIKEISGETAGFEAVIHQEKDEKQETQQDLLQTLFQDFGRGNVQVDDD